MRQHVTGTTDVTDYTFVKACAVSLASLSSFRDPIITGAHGTDGAGPGESPMRILMGKTQTFQQMQPLRKRH